MKLTSLWKDSKRPTISFELFPARTEKGALALINNIDRLAELNPDFVSVTFGAGGSTKDGSRQLIERLKNEYNLEVLAYLAIFGLTSEEITDVLDRYKDIGLENILAVRGDKPREGDIDIDHGIYKHSSELVLDIKGNYDFCVGVAGYPEGHIEAPNIDSDIGFLKQKIDNGAEYIITNYFYDNAFFMDFVKRCRKNNINIPILPGIMPVYSIKMMNMLAELCGAKITDNLKNGLSKLPQDDKAALIDFGVKYATAQCEELLNEGVTGLHFYTMDKSESTVQIINNLREKGLL
jgi:methylenetetrahydrofolate reductase (NADPH)